MRMKYFDSCICCSLRTGVLTIAITSVVFNLFYVTIFASALSVAEAQNPSKYRTHSVSLYGRYSKFHSPLRWIRPRATGHILNRILLIGIFQRFHQLSCYFWIIQSKTRIPYALADPKRCFGGCNGNRKLSLLNRGTSWHWNLGMGFHLHLRYWVPLRAVLSLYAEDGSCIPRTTDSRAINCLVWRIWKCFYWNIFQSTTNYCFTKQAI